MEYFFHRRDHKVKNGLGGINVVELLNNRAQCFDGGCDVQSNFIVNCFRETRLSSLRVRLIRRERSLERSQTFSSGVS